MKVTFVYPDITAVDPYWKGGYYVGVSSLSSQLKVRGHQTSLIHILNPYYGREDFLKDLQKDGPSDLYAFSATTLGFPWVRRWCQWLHDEGIHVPTICGGSHPSVDAEHAIQADHLDMICLGEGEGAMCDLVEALEQGKPYHEIPNLWVKHDGEIYRNELRPLIPDLDVLEHPDREIWTNWEELYWEKQGYAAVVASRGCPFKCTYCVNHTYMELFPDKQYVRFRSPDNTIDELKGILNRYPHIHGFNFDDDILYMQRPWSIEFTEKYKKEIGLPFYCNMRPNVCKPDMVSLLKEAGCIVVRAAIESGNEYIRNTLLKRELKESDMLTAFHRLESAGIRTFSFNMVGLPFETPENVLETVKMNARSRASFAQAWIFYPFPGTELQRLCEENGFFRKGHDEIYVLDQSILDMPTMSRKQIIAYRFSFQPALYMYRFIYESLPKPVAAVAEKMLDKIFVSKYWPAIAHGAMQPLRQTYRYVIRPVQYALMKWKYGRKDAEGKEQLHIVQVDSKEVKFRTPETN